MEESNAAQPAEAFDPATLLPARSALERGDYGTCERLLEPLLQAHGAMTRAGGEIRLLLATAQLGRGDHKAAAATCRSLRACRDTTLRAQAKDLQEILDAPALVRPREWSMTLPSLGEMKPLEGELKAMARQRRRRRGPPEPPPPPTGPTQAPLGFAVVAIVLLLLTALLGGCVDLETQLRFPGPGRLQFEQRSQSQTDQPLPWQSQWRQGLRGRSLRVDQDHGRLTLASPVLPAAQALRLLQDSLEQGAALANLDLPAPELDFQERNWLIGVRQRLAIQLDLETLQPLPGLQLSVALEPLPLRAIQSSGPIPARAMRRGKGEPEAVRWRLEPGAVNTLQLSCWRWSKLGLGTLAISLLLLLVALLQRLRIAAGFGLPQLPA